MSTEKREKEHQERVRIGTQLREAMEAARLTAGDVAERTGLRAATVRNIIAGRFNVGIDELAMVAECVWAEVNVEQVFNIMRR